MPPRGGRPFGSGVHQGSATESTRSSEAVGKRLSFTYVEGTVPTARWAERCRESSSDLRGVKPRRTVKRHLGLQIRVKLGWRTQCGATGRACFGSSP